mmetsp:Transcript_7284/g.25540  ORF Transcript_7284/g.25540 Transcript_7284/m.25540 type:complete len:471 (+) Transcript_7284:735-2147(+)
MARRVRLTAARIRGSSSGGAARRAALRAVAVVGRCARHALGRRTPGAPGDVARGPPRRAAALGPQRRREKTRVERQHVPRGEEDGIQRLQHHVHRLEGDSDGHDAEVARQALGVQALVGGALLARQRQRRSDSHGRRAEEQDRARAPGRRAAPWRQGARPTALDVEAQPLRRRPRAGQPPSEVGVLEAAKQLRGPRRLAAQTRQAQRQAGRQAVEGPRPRRRQVLGGGDRGGEPGHFRRDHRREARRRVLEKVRELEDGQDEHPDGHARAVGHRGEDADRAQGGGANRGRATEEPEALEEGAGDVLEPGVRALHRAAGDAGGAARERWRPVDRALPRHAVRDGRAHGAPQHRRQRLHRGEQPLPRPPCCLEQRRRRVRHRSDARRYMLPERQVPAAIRNGEQLCALRPRPRDDPQRFEPRASRRARLQKPASAQARQAGRRDCLRLPRVVLGAGVDHPRSKGRRRPGTHC